MDVYIHFQHTFMFKQLVKWIFHPMTPLIPLNSIVTTELGTIVAFGKRTPSERVRESFDSDRNFGAGLWIIWFRSELRSGFVNHLIQIGTSERGSELRSGFVNHLIQIGTSERVCESLFGAGFLSFSFFIFYLTPQNIKPLGQFRYKNKTEKRKKA